MAYIEMTRDFSKVKKIVSGTGLTKRQLVAFLCGAVLGLPVYYLLKTKCHVDVSSAILWMAIVGGIVIYILLYEKDGMHIEKYISYFVETYFIRNTDRPYRTQNIYEMLQQEQELQKEIEKIVFAGMTEKQIKKVKSSGVSSEIKIGKKKIRIPVNGPIPMATKMELVKAVKKAKMQGKIPTSAQESIPYEKPYEDGIFESAPGYFTQTIAFEDITYQLLDEEYKDEIFDKWSSLINFFDENKPFQLCYGNMEMNREEYEKELAIPKDDSDNKIRRVIRKEYSDHQIKQFTKGTNNLKRVRYLTFGVYAKDYPSAKRKLVKDAKHIQKKFKKMGSNYKLLNGYERLELLFYLFHPGTKKKFLWNFDMLVKTGLSSKDFISPSSFCFKPSPDFNATKYFKVGDRIGAVSYIHIYANEMDDRIIDEILSINSNIWISFNGRALNRIDALNYAKDNINDIQQMIVANQRSAVERGYDMDLLPPELRDYQDASEQLFRDVRRKDQKMINATITVVQTAKSRKKLEDNVHELENILNGFQCKLSRADNRQEQGYMSSLPLGNNFLDSKRTFTTSDLAIFIPFTTNELYAKQGQLYGINSLSNNVIMVNKKKSANPNTLILGAPGFGKSFFTKLIEVLDTFLKTKDHILIVDPEGEYKWLVKLLGGQVVDISLNSKEHINFMEIDLNRRNEQDIDDAGKVYEPVAAKCNFVVSVCEQIMGKNGELDEDKKAVIDYACNNIYKRFAKEPIKEKMPIPEDLYNELRGENLPEEMKEFGKKLSVALSRYVNGSLSYFNHRSTINIHSRLVCYNLKNMDEAQKKVTMLMIQENVWGRVAENREKGIYTRTIFEEFHLLLKEPKTAEYMVSLWKRLRKWGGIPTGVTQNVKDLFRSQQIENILDTTNCIVMLNQLGDDANILAAHLNLSVEEMGYIQSGEVGKGLIWIERTKVPFENEFPQNTLCYKILTTKLEESIKAS